jgi:ABC-type multidrug transport system fused ATPase/permease subunit
MSPDDRRKAMPMLGAGRRSDSRDAPPLSKREIARLLTRTWALLKPYVVGRLRPLSTKGPPWLRVWTGAHVAWFYLAVWSVQILATILGVFMLDLLYQTVLGGRPLTPSLAHLFGRAADAYSRLSIAERRQLLWLYGGLMLGTWAVTAPALALLPLYNIWIQQRINQDLRLALVERWHRLSPRYHLDHRAGDSVYRVFQDSAQVTTVIGRIIAAIGLIGGVAAAIATLALFDARLAGLATLMGAPLVLLAAWVTPRLGALSLRARAASSDLTSRVQERLSHVRTIKANGQEAREQAAFERDSVAAFNAAYGLRSLIAIATVAAFVSVAACLLPAEYVMATAASAGRATAAAGLMTLIGLSFGRWNAAAFTWSQGRMFAVSGGARGLMAEWSGVQDTAMALRRVFDILDTAPDVDDAPDARPLPTLARDIRFEAVDFAYVAARPVLRGVSFAARVGEITAVVGPTGSGKSTLMTLMLRLFDPDAGRIMIDGVDLRSLRLADLRGRIAVAMQESPLFAISVADNIRYAAPLASDAEVAAAARLACAHDFIENLPLGYATVLGDRGSGLSPGQRQRISIARALVKDSPILLLDEPTAALDPATEQVVMDNLAGWSAGRAIFLITHRLSTIRRADQILFLEDGTVAECGPHDALMGRLGGRYRRMVEAETSGISAEVECG